MNRLKNAFGEHCHGTKKDRGNQNRILFWTFSWTLSWVLVSLGLKKDWLPDVIMGIGGTLICAVLGGCMMLAYGRYLREADELRRKIELESFALAVGVGLIGGVSFWILEKSGVIGEWKAFDITVLLICFTHGIAVFLGHRRYS